MDSIDAGTTPHSLETARVVPIAELSPDLPDPTTTAVCGVVTITWPYNKVKGTFAFSLAEPDFRRRRNKGQVRIDFTGRAAEVVGNCGLGSNDEVLLGLAGAAWETEASNKRRSLPGADLGWKLIFSESLFLKIKRAETSETDLVVVNEQPNQRETTPDPASIQRSTMTEPPSPPAPFSPIRTTSPVREISRKRLHDSEFASPAFIKRARMSYGSLFEDGFDIFKEDSGVEGKRRKRTRFGRDSNAWRYMSHSPSPEPAAAASPEKADEQASSPTRIASSPTMVQMTDEGCQTMELDRSSPQPASIPLEIHLDMTVPEPSPVNDSPFDASTEAVIEQTQMPHSNGLPLEKGAQNASAPDYGEVPDSEVNAPQPYFDQRVSPSRGSLADNPWNVDVMPSAFEQQQKASFPPLHVDESLTSLGFGNTTSGNQPIPFDESDSLNKSHVGDGENQGSINDGIIPSTELHPPAFNYPPLDPIEDTHPQPVQDEALTNYPASYLEDSRTSLPNQMMDEQTTQKPAVAELGTNSWATVNQISNASAMPPTDRLGSRDGSTPEQALVIGESDSDSDSSPEPMAVEDTLNEGRAYALDMYQDAEAEDEADAQYSDDDEPEYDADEMGGDYDTRNYERPDDDDDGGYDEDPRPHHLEPEFEEGESWDEEEQEEFLDEEGDGEYELDEDIPEPRPQPVVRTNPTVIDLISSSEDESEGEDDDVGEDGTTTGIQGSGAHIDSRISSSPQKTNSEDDSPRVHLNDEDSEIVSQAPMSEPDDSSEVGVEDDGYTSSYQEEEVVDGDDPEDPENEEDDDADDDGDDDGAEAEGKEEGIDQKIRPESYEQEEAHMLELSEYRAEQHPEQETNSGHETMPGNDATLVGVDNEDDTLSHQTMHPTEMLESAVTGNRIEGPEVDTSIEPLSAADGLDMLSRAVDKESSVRNHDLYVETAVESVVMETISEQQSPIEPPEHDDVQMQDLLDSQLNAALEAVLEEASKQDDGEDQVDQIISSKSDTEHSTFAISHMEPSAAAPSSPPPTQSFQSRIEGDGKSTSEEAAITSTTQVATAQLPTPLDTQVTDTTLNTSTNIHMTLAESFDSYTTIEPQDSTPIVELEGRKPIHEPFTVSSPAPSFRSQVDDKELAWPESEEEQMKIDSQLNQEFFLDPSSDESDTNESFTSHMHIDEELQASIMENSLLEEYNSDDVHGELDEPNRFDTNEDSWKSERGGQAEIVPSSLHDNTPAKQLADEISAQLRRNFVTNSSTSSEDSDTSLLNDPSVHLARVANASKRAKRKSASSNHFRYPRGRTLDIRRSPTPDTDNSSMQLARASLSCQTPKSEEDSPSMTAAKLQLARHLRDELPDFCLLEALRQHVTKSLDVIAVAAMRPPDPRRAKGGPREYMMSFTISDYSIGPYNVAEAFIYRPHKESLPVIKYGDVVLFRNFTVVALAGKGFGLRSNDVSSWAVFDYEDEPAQIRGPPVEYIQREIAYVNYLREWFNLLDAKARARLERATQDFINAGKSK